MKFRFAIVPALAAIGALGAAAAQARDVDVQWSVTIGIPALVYAPTPAVPTYRMPPPVYHPDRAMVYRAPTRWDRDGDGIPNRHDRLFNPVWDRDGDGIPNRYDRPSRHHGDRDHDGIPNRWDRHDDRPWR